MPGGVAYWNVLTDATWLLCALLLLDCVVCTALNNSHACWEIVCCSCGVFIIFHECLAQCGGLLWR